MRICLAIISVLVLASVGVAAEPISGNLDEVLSLAARQQQPAHLNGQEVPAYRALRKLETWPPVSAVDESRIAAIFISSLEGKDANFRNAGAWGLGRRGHAETISLIIELGETDPNLIGGFFQALQIARPQIALPVEQLRLGLKSRNPSARARILEVIANYRVVMLRSEIEAILESDSSSAVRNSAASALWRLGLKESLPTLRRVFATGFRSEGVAYSLTQLGDDKDIADVLPLLKSSNEQLRATVAAGLESAKPIDSRPACDALLEALHDPSREIRLHAINALGHFREPRAIVAIRQLLTDSTESIPWEDRDKYVTAVSAIATPDGILLLNDMARMEFLNHFGLERALIHLASPSSARAVWATYLEQPIRINLESGSDLPIVGYFKGLDVLTACADAALLQQIVERLALTNDPAEKAALADVVKRIQARNPQGGSSGAQLN